MNRPRNLILAVMFVILGAAFSAADIYIAPSAAGSANGASCSNAYAYTFFNTAGNWGSGASQIGAGTTVHLCSGTYSLTGGNNNGLSFQGGGTSGNPVTLIADQGAVTLTAASWGNGSGPSIGVINTNGNSYLTINGDNQLTLQASANGTGLANQTDWGNGVVAYGGSGVTIENLTVSNIYVHTCTEPVSNCTDEGGQDTGGISAYGNEILVQGTTVHDAKLCISGNYPASITYVNEQYLNNTTYNCDHGFELGAGSTGSTITGMVVAGNNISAFQNWDDNANNNHHDGIHEFAYNSGDSVTGLQVYNNYIHGDFGNNFNAGIYVESTTQTTGAYYFNNLIVDQSSVEHLGCGLICLENNGASIYNNTITQPGVSGNTAINNYGTGVYVENNIIDTAFEAIAFSSGGTYARVDYNDYYNIGGSGWNQNGSFSGWQSSCNCDSHSSTANPNLSANYVPTSNSTALIQKAANLTGLSIAALDLDKVGMIRPPQPTSWSIGAFQYNSSTAPAPPNPPTGLAAVVH